MKNLLRLLDVIDSTTHSYIQLFCKMKKTSIEEEGRNRKIGGLGICQCAWHLRKGDKTSTAIKEAKAETGYAKDSDKEEKTVESVKLLLANDSGAKKEVRYYKVLGFAMHVLGDTYAHRTIVPSYTVDNCTQTPKKSTNAKSADARFGMEDFKKSHNLHADEDLRTWAKDSYALQGLICKRWNCFQRAVKLGVVEFKDIKNFATRKAYEDDSAFCKERYKDAEFCCEILFDTFYSKSKYEGVYIIYPTRKNVKLNGFKRYSEKAKQDTSWLTPQEWEEKSTPKVY